MTHALIVEFQDTLYKIRNKIGSRKLYKEHLDELFDRILADPAAHAEFLELVQRSFQS
jgi:hypothetical protein